MTPSPYQIACIDTDAGPTFRLTGPGLNGTKAYAGADHELRLREMASLMNHAFAEALNDREAVAQKARESEEA